MFKLLKFIKGYRIRALLAPLFKMLEATFELLVPIVMVKLVDIGIAGNNKGYILKCGAVLIMLTIVGYLFSITAQYFAAKSAIGFGKELRKALFKHIMSLSYTEQDKSGASTLITRMTSDVNQAVSGVNMILRLFLRSPFIVFGAVIMAFLVDFETSMVFLIILPVLTIVVFGITYVCIPMYKNVQNRLDKVTLLTRESLIGVRVIRAFNRQDIERKEFGDAANVLKKSQLRVGVVSGFMNPVTFLIVNLGIAMLIKNGSVRVNIGELTQGQVIALVNYMSQILVELVKLANLIITLTKTAASFHRLSDIFDIKPGTEFPESLSEEASSESVVFHKVSMIYSDSKENSIEDISFTAKKGEIIGIIGGTGSGKSSLVNLIPRFYDICEGSLTINGIDIEKYPREELRGMIGIVPQKAVLFRGSIADNLRMSKPDATEEEINNALKMAEAYDFVNQKENGIDYMITENGTNLSGGQRQRLTMARAFVKNPYILILDDSTSALDYGTEAKVRKNLRKYSDGRITFIVSQRASSVMHADKIIVMDDGKAVGIGKHDELMKINEIYRDICLTQLSEKEGMAV
ncbi:MAG: ABC transporter ATP-binding protein/permease [Eubacterium sp.]|nr:ABC transporter ATP-binding protein/permease [Eubacterium sp.]